MSNKNKRTGNQDQQVIDANGKPIDVDPCNMPNADPGDGVDTEPKGLAGFFIKVIRGGKKVWSKTPTPIKVGLGVAVLAGTGAAAGKIGYEMAEKHYKPLIPTTNDTDEETYEALDDDDDTEYLEDMGYTKVDVDGVTVYTDDPTVAETLNTPSGEATSE